jgi:SH3 domain protein
MQTVSHEKQTLEESTSQDWFLIGAGVLLGGIILGLILPRISWRRKTSSWDSF